METAMEYGSIERELHIDASPEVVFEVLSSPEHIREWWSAETAFEPVAGATARLTWTDEDTGRQQSSPFTVMEADPPRMFSFRWTYDETETEAAGPGNSLLVTFELVPTEKGTTVRFRESGYRERGWEAAVLEAHYNDHRQGWDFYLPRLVATADRLAATR
ncbi:SRPBCC domain-containing protein [Streptomyces virginiae]|uniref:SRPBCC domain-containing protein n=1 Tax=Streptomyces virginiae TaxID=1961 RepID=UPI00224D37E7|nr:SRPBCC domain-containing protein [Streptomyces virginiae]MCX4720887.1 SRPBCC domain-containing protein [Streptomyces virginiae]MCX5270121.1 SRPBCC domain-containing protein [Streptomyces virginiae]